MHPSTDVNWLNEMLSKINSLEGLFIVAAAELKKFPNGAEIVFGPISEGGYGNTEINLIAFDAVVQNLLEEGKPIFNIRPYQERIDQLHVAWREEGELRSLYHHMRVLEEFYMPLYRTGAIKRAWFIPGWTASVEASWTRDKFEDNSNPIEITDLSATWVDSVLI